MTEQPRHPNWKFAESALEAVVGGKVPFEIEDLPGLSPDMWVECELDEASDSANWERLCGVVGYTPSARLIVVSFPSFRGLGPFFTSVEALPEFFVQYREAAKESVFSNGGDLFFLAPDSQRMIVWHHSELAVALG